MDDGEQEPGIDVEVYDAAQAERDYGDAEPVHKEAIWLELWHARDFTWHGRSEKAMLQTEMVEVPASFPDGREAEGEFKTVSLKDYWRWSIGLPGEERLLTDEEMRAAGLLVEVEGETYHLIHAPDFSLKQDQEGAPLQVLKDIVSARGAKVPEDIVANNYVPKFAKALQLSGGWLPGLLVIYAGEKVATELSGAHISAINLGGLKLGHLKCVETLFSGEANFGDALFRGDADFDNATFVEGSNFTHASFGGEGDRTLSFTGVTFIQTADFSSAYFNCYTSFRRATFYQGEADFSEANFEKQCDFYETQFLNEAQFRKVKFGDRADFRKAVFNDRSRFYEACFNAGAGFGEAQFNYGADFRSTIFKGVFSGHLACFNGKSDFADVTFDEEASFQDANFNGWIFFRGATFKSPAKFVRAIFTGIVNFGGSTFNSTSSFENVTWPEALIDNAFRNVRFQDRADFSGDNFLAISALHEARFDIEPVFSDPANNETDETIFRRLLMLTKATIKQDAKARKANEKTKTLERDGKPVDHLTPDDRWAALSGGYRTLKRIANRKGDFLMEQTYYRYETKIRIRRPRIPLWERVAARLYGLSSDYGNSIAQPFVSLAVILAGFAAIYLALAIEVNLIDWQDRAALQSGFFESLDFSLKNVFRPLSALSTDAPREGDASSLAGKLLNNYGKGFGLIVTAISIVQSLTGIVLAFLFGLAVRRRFQIS
jgi:hypothetical protein